MHGTFIGGSDCTEQGSDRRMSGSEVGNRVKAEKRVKSYLLTDVPRWSQVFMLPLHLFRK